MLASAEFLRFPLHLWRQKWIKKINENKFLAEAPAPRPAGTDYSSMKRVFRNSRSGALDLKKKKNQLSIFTRVPLFLTHTHILMKQWHPRAGSYSEDARGEGEARKQNKRNFLWKTSMNSTCVAWSEKNQVYVPWRQNIRTTTNLSVKIWRWEQLRTMKKVMEATGKKGQNTEKDSSWKLAVTGHLRNDDHLKYKHPMKLTAQQFPCAENPKSSSPSWKYKFPALRQHRVQCTISFSNQAEFILLWQ